MHLKGEINHTLLIEKSRFICYMKQVDSETDYKSYLSIIQKKHYDATHVCSAMICGNIKRSSDDGEPSGTAGVPILNVLEKNHLDHTCALVVRYFGGIKLGAGGLIRAYTSSVTEALQEATLVEEVNYPKYSLTLSYEMANKIEHYLRTESVLLNTDYQTEVTFTFALDNEKKLETIQEYTKGLLPTPIGFQTIEKLVK